MKNINSVETNNNNNNNNPPKKKKKKKKIYIWKDPIGCDGDR